MCHAAYELSNRWSRWGGFRPRHVDLVAQVATRIAVMRAGQFVEAGPAEEVLHQAKNPYTRELLAAVPELPRA